LNKDKIREIIFTPIIAKMVTLGELKTSYTLKDFIALLETSGNVINSIKEI
jgi:hypothetical protein